MSPCDCQAPPVRSSRERAPGAQLVHVDDARGTWHAVQVGGQVYRLAIVAPSAAELAQRAADAARVQPKPVDPLAVLARAVLDGLGADTRVTADDRAELEKLAERGT